MNEVKVLDKTFRKSISHDKIMETVARMAADMDRDLMGKDPLFLSILNGAFIFSSDLFKMLQMPCTISFVKFASYAGDSSTGKVKELIGLSEDLKGRNIVILEDIIDTGLTMQQFLPVLEKKKPASVRIASLLYKPEAFKGSYSIDYIGMSIPNDFIVGYGLDYKGYGRNLKAIYTVI
ncbi:MAG: hypoxanthine phosphoribosyltransferase [Bacteroidetes bacterium]|jgi:hypoxanthine phosphoribosyltransferase|nr:hypoxanthine phosphoribosyltransferase [Bacteroidota bacterium]MBT3748548.1 hypoxanthine phosphoribosyltransferase [Bacteroidota bacterium]MBT4398979.1 hypoxanthine phosphoribosyltransferase [Bacteroidota bacterium]MBT4411257.1 hypoxanthine phosphoribosyltransferase [Bacteroidota bacterium]MBT5426344.1 hypoxanthine phosphoribosyltransferase [Bacteroidota bacterium]